MVVQDWQYAIVTGLCRRHCRAIWIANRCLTSAPWVELGGSKPGTPGARTAQIGSGWLDQALIRPYSGLLKFTLMPRHEQARFEDQSRNSISQFQDVDPAVLWPPNSQLLHCPCPHNPSLFGSGCSRPVVRASWGMRWVEMRCDRWKGAYSTNVGVKKLDSVYQLLKGG
jgi:hypothetical protein